MNDFSAGQQYRKIANPINISVNEKLYFSCCIVVKNSIRIVLINCTSIIKYLPVRVFIDSIFHFGCFSGFSSTPSQPIPARSNFTRNNIRKPITGLGTDFPLVYMDRRYRGDTDETIQFP